MARNILKLAYTEAKSHRVLISKVLNGREWVPTSDESTTNNRTIYYDVDCKACNATYTKSKASLLKPHTCPRCFTEHEATTPKQISKGKPAVALFFADLDFAVFSSSVDNAVENLAPEDLARWKAFGKKTAVSDGLGRFLPVVAPELVVPMPNLAQQVTETLPPTTLAEPPEPLQAAPTLQIPAHQPETLPTPPRPKPASDGYPFETSAAATSEPPTLNRTEFEESETADHEGFCRDLRHVTGICNLAPHHPKRKTFNGWLISRNNLVKLQNKKQALTDSQLALKAAGEKDIDNKFVDDRGEEAPLRYFEVAAPKGKQSRDWLYLYAHHPEYDPLLKLFTQEQINEMNLNGLRVSKEHYRVWHEKRLAEEKAQTGEIMTPEEAQAIVSKFEQSHAAQKE